jgi:hypothetical protein
LASASCFALSKGELETPAPKVLTASSNVMKNAAAQTYLVFMIPPLRDRLLIFNRPRSLRRRNYRFEQAKFDDTNIGRRFLPMLVASFVKR